MQTDEYQTIAAPAETEIKIKASRFIGSIYPVSTPDEAMRVLESVARRYFDATHHCFAYRIGTGDSILFRFSDDGEPSGTAGKPILQVIQTYPLTNAILIVTRYYGGIKLGTGGLIRAYSLAASETIQKATVITCVLTQMLFLRLSYSDSPIVMRHIHQRNAQIVNSQYGECIELSVRIRRSAMESFISELTQLTGGRVEVDVNL